MPPPSACSRRASLVGRFPSGRRRSPTGARTGCSARSATPTGSGTRRLRRQWEAKRFTPELADYTALVEPAAVPAADTEEEQG